MYVGMVAIPAPKSATTTTETPTMIRNSLPIRSLPVLAVALVFLLAAAPLALAQGPNGPGPNNGPGPGDGQGPGFGPGPGAQAAGLGVPLRRLATWLELTEEQIARAEAIFSAAREAAVPIRDAQKALHAEMRTLLDSDAPDAAAVGAVVLELHANRAELRALREAAFADLEALLTAEQLEKLEQLKELRNHFGHRRGGAHRFGPGSGAGAGAGFGPGFGDCPNL